MASAPALSLAADNIRIIDPSSLFSPRTAAGLVPGSGLHTSCCTNHPCFSLSTAAFVARSFVRFVVIPRLGCTGPVLRLRLDSLQALYISVDYYRIISSDMHCFLYDIPALIYPTCARRSVYLPLPHCRPFYTTYVLPSIRNAAAVASLEPECTMFVRSHTRGIPAIHTMSPSASVGIENKRAPAWASRVACTAEAPRALSARVRAPNLRSMELTPITGPGQPVNRSLVGTASTGHAII